MGCGASGPDQEVWLTLSLSLSGGGFETWRLHCTWNLKTQQPSNNFRLSALDPSYIHSICLVFGGWTNWHLFGWSTVWQTHKSLFVCSWHSALPIHHNSLWGGDLRVAIHGTWPCSRSRPWTADKLLQVLSSHTWGFPDISRHLKMCEAQTIPGVTRQCIACCLEIAEQQRNSIVASHALQLCDCKTNASIHLLRHICRSSGWEWMKYTLIRLYVWLKLDLNSWMCHEYASNV